MGELAMVTCVHDFSVPKTEPNRTAVLQTNSRGERLNAFISFTEGMVFVSHLVKHSLMAHLLPEHPAVRTILDKVISLLLFLRLLSNTNKPHNRK